MGGPSDGDEADKRLGGNMAAWVLSHGERRRDGGFSVVMVHASRLLGLSTNVAAVAVVRTGDAGLLVTTAAVLLWLALALVVVVVVVAGGDLVVTGPADFVAALADLLVAMAGSLDVVTAAAGPMAANLASKALAATGLDEAVAAAAVDAAGNDFFDDDDLVPAVVVVAVVGTAALDNAASTAASLDVMLLLPMDCAVANATVAHAVV
jgi:hypothetical protein